MDRPDRPSVFVRITEDEKRKIDAIAAILSVMPISPAVVMRFLLERADVEAIKRSVRTS